MKRVIIAVILTWCVVAPSQAIEFKPYSGVGFGIFNLKAEALGSSQNNVVAGGFAKFGVDVGDYLGFELRAGKTGSGTKAYTARAFGLTIPFSVKLSTDYFLTYLVKLQMPERHGWKDGWRSYGLIGATTAKGKIQGSVIGFSATADATKTGLSYGGGVEYKFNNNMSAGVEFISYWNRVSVSNITDASILGGSATLNYEF